ncbi:amidase signature enzyme [Nemania sp. FL0031]|nr:amidase signature enzyme [Nemania sp. FL0031]
MSPCMGTFRGDAVTEKRRRYYRAGNNGLYATDAILDSRPALIPVRCAVVSKRHGLRAKLNGAQHLVAAMDKRTVEPDSAPGAKRVWLKGNRRPQFRFSRRAQQYRWTSGVVSDLDHLCLLKRRGLEATGKRTKNMTNIRTHTIVGLGGASYYLGDQVEFTLSCSYGNPGRITPAVVLHADYRKITADFLRSEFERYNKEDDVFQHDFSRNGVLLLVSNWDKETTPTFFRLISQYLSLLSSTIVLLDERRESLPDGPYFIQGVNLFQAWRLYSDTNEVFTLPVISAKGGHPYAFEPLGLADSSGLYRAIAVPSRLYSPPTPERPLNGLRITVKDNYHLAGVYSTLGSRSWTKLYDAQESTAVLVRQLLDLGAVIIGKTKMSAYAGSEIPPEKTIDYLAPFNPRADGHQGPSGSSSGAGASVASYDWVDLALGTDTTGSIRMPAASYGLWGLRATWGSWPLEGIMPGVPAFDTIGALARSPDILKRFLLSGGQPGKVITPRSILLPTDWFPMGNPGQQRMIDSFVDILKAYLNSIYWPNYFDGYDSYDTFRQEFQEKYGFPPYTSPFMTKRWGLCDHISKEQRDQGLREIEVYYTWVRDHVVKEGLEDNIMVLPLGRPGANYRDIVPQPGAEFSTSAYDPIDFASVLGLPQLVIPVGQNAFESRVTKRTEYVPIVASLTGPRGSDESLVNIAEEAIRKAGWETTVLCGAYAFEVENNERNAKHVGPMLKL